jgi:biopolymer transport protein ExbD
MAGKLADDDSSLMADINVTPFVDVVLVLLVILMVTSTQIVRASLHVDLPQAAAAGDSVESTVNIVITKDGQYYLDGVMVQDVEIVARLQREHALHPKLQAVIAADRGCIYASVVHIIDLVKSNGVKSFALNVDREAPSGP